MEKVVVNAKKEWLEHTLGLSRVEAKPELLQWREEGLKPTHLEKNRGVAHGEGNNKSWGLQFP